MDPIEYFLVGGALLTLFVGAIFDLRTRRIPNAITFGSALAGLVANLVIHQIPGGGQSIEGWLAGVGILLLPFMTRGVGGGDVKLLAAAGAWYGPLYVFHSLFWAALVGSIIALALMAARGELLSSLRVFFYRGAVIAVIAIATVVPSIFNVAPAGLRRLRVGEVARSGLHRTFPFGPALALGGVAALVLGWM